LALFEGLLEWVNDNLARAKWLALYGSPEQASWARLLPGDDPSPTLRGGGLTLALLGFPARHRESRATKARRSSCLGWSVHSAGRA
jgi:hypothetical protein